MVRPVTQQPVSNTFPPREVGDRSVPKERISRPSDTFEVANARPGQARKEGWSVQDVLDGTQLVLDLAGFVPGVGEVADAANVGISALRGDSVNAALSAVSLIPVAGDAIGKGAKALLRASNTPAAKKAAQQLFKLVSKTDFAAFYKSLERALERVPQFRQQARRVVAEVSRGLDEVMSTLAEKFGLPRPVFATVDGPTPGLNQPPRRPGGSPGGTAANASQQALETAARQAVEDFAKRPALDELLELGDQVSNGTRTAVSTAFKNNQHLRDHVLPAGDGGLKKLMTELRNRTDARGIGRFSAFPSTRAAEVAAGHVLQAAKDKGVDLLNPRALPADLKQLANGQSLVKDGITYARGGDGKLSATLKTSFETGVEFTSDKGAVRTKATNGIRLVVSSDGLGLTTVFPVKL